MEPYKPQVLYGTISANSGTSTVIDLRGYSLVSVAVPGTVLGTLLTFQSSFDGASYWPVTDSAANTVSAVYGTAGAQIITDLPELSPLRYIKLVTSGTQSADKIFGVIVK